MPESGFPGCTKHPERDQSLHLQGPCPGLLLVILNPRTLLPMFSSWHPAQPAPPSGHEVQTPHPTPTLLQLSLGPCWSHIPRLTALLPHALLLTTQVWVSPNCEPLQGKFESHASLKLAQGWPLESTGNGERGRWVEDQKPGEKGSCCGVYFWSMC